MRILFLQNMDDAQGGIVQVNCALGGAFLQHGDEVRFLSLRHSGYADAVEYPAAASKILIDEEREWGCPRLSAALKQFRSGRAGEGVRTLSRRVFYDASMRADFRRCREQIAAYAPDILINSHYELLNCIPPALLGRTINHFHTNFGQVRGLRSYRRILGKYRDKLGRFVWLSRSSCEEAAAAGWTNSSYIYNPIRFVCCEAADNSPKRMIFLGRISPEKRLKLAAELFCEACARLGTEEWSLDIYGVGEPDEATKTLILSHPQIHFLGSTNAPEQVLPGHGIFLMTSSYEGMPVAVLEANECGVPAIAFSFGETTKEVIRDGETGIVIPEDDREAYLDGLCRLMSDGALRARLGAAARDFAVDFHLESIAGQWYSLFGDLLSGTRSEG